MNSAMTVDTRWHEIMTADPGEMDIELTVEGTVPPVLQGGDYLLNGPVKLSQNGRTFHPFDGHGYIRRFRFQGETIALTSRYLKTKDFLADERSGGIKSRGIGTLPHRNWLKNLFTKQERNPGNTTIYPWAGKLICGYEGGLPHAIDPETLETIGLEDFSGALPKKMRFLAHARYDAAQNRLVGLSSAPGGSTAYTFSEINAVGGLVKQKSFKASGLSLPHDFLLTEHYYIVLENPMAPVVWRFLKSLVALHPLISSVQQHTGPMRAFLLPRGEGEVQVIEFDKSGTAIHMIGAEEHLDEAGQVTDVVMLACRFDRYENWGAEFGYQGSNKPFAFGRLAPETTQRICRLTANLATGKGRTEKVADWGLDFPTVHPHSHGKKCTHVYGAASLPMGEADPFNAVVRLNLETGDSQSWQSEGILGEPLFVPDGDGDATGAVVAVNYLNHGAELLFFDAANIDAGPVGKAPIPLMLPYGFHGAFLRA